MKFILFLLFTILPCSAHEWNSMFVETRVADGQLVSEIQFDASVVDPETKDDPLALARKRPWLISLSSHEHENLQKSAITYLTQCFSFTSSSPSSKPLSSIFEFSDWKTTPPSFPKTLDGFAYFTVKIYTQLPTEGKVTLVNAANEKSPTINLRHYDSTGTDHSHLIAPGKEASFLTVEKRTLSSTQAKTTPISPTFVQTIYSGLHSGFIHVLPKGYDHILFILSLCLLSTRWKHIIWHSLLFTFTHSITFILLSLQLISLSDPWRLGIEITILASIIAMAVENLLSKQSSKRRVFFIALFGLVHGLGFASAFGEAIVSQSGNSIPILISANLGIELAQLSVVLIVFFALFKLSSEKRTKANIIGSAIIIPVTLAIAILNFF